MMILKDIGIASRGDASPNVSSRVISTQIPGIRSDTSTSYLLLAEDDAEDDDTDTDVDDDTLVSLVSFVVVLLLLPSWWSGLLITGISTWSEELLLGLFWTLLEMVKIEPKGDLSPVLLYSSKASTKGYEDVLDKYMIIMKQPSGIIIPLIM